MSAAPEPEVDAMGPHPGYCVCESCEEYAQTLIDHHRDLMAAVEWDATDA